MSLSRKLSGFVVDFDRFRFPSTDSDARRTLVLAFFGFYKLYYTCTTMNTTRHEFKQQQQKHQF